MKKIIVINGSPHREKSTTMKVTKAFVEGMLKEDCEVEYVNIADLNIKPCLGCLSCWGRTPGECVIRGDDIAELRAKIKASDFVIESYPLYFGGMPGPMKTFTDRMLGMMCTYIGQAPNHVDGTFHKVRDPREGQKFLIISGCAFTEAEETYLPLRMQYEMICGRGNYTLITCPQLKTLADIGTDARINRYLSKFTAAGSMYAKQGEIDKETLDKLCAPPFSPATYRVLLDKFWQGEREKGKVND